MCRNITTLRGLEPKATNDEIEAAARQYVRKVSGVSATSKNTNEAFEKAVHLVARATADLLRELPPRLHPPAIQPPLRRIRPTTS
jgi:hypothetical protein